MTKVVVRINPEVAEIVPVFMKNREKDILSLREALKARNFEIIRGRGHDMKGAGSGYGFDEISKIGAGLEQAAKFQDISEIEKGVETLHRYLQNVEIIYE